MSQEFAQRLARLQEELQDLAIEAEGVSTEADAIEIQAKIQIRADEMEEVAKAWQAFEMEKHGLEELPGTGTFTVQLTDQQREMVREAAGIDMEVLEVEGSQSWLSTMSHTKPQQFDHLMLAEAHRRVARREARMELKIQLEEMAAGDNEELRKHVQALMVDPDFAGGLLLEED